MSGLTSQLNKLGLGSKAATVSSSSSSTTTSNTSSSSSTSTAPVQSSLTAALANRPRHKKSISGGNPEHGFDLGRLAPMPTAPGSTGSQTRTLQASKRQQSSSTNSNSKPILISSKSTGGRGKTGREGGPTLAQSAPTVHYVPPPAPSARPRIASFDPPPMALPPSPDTRGPLANVLRQSISKGPSSRAHKKNDAAAAQARQQRSLSMYPSSAPAHNINYMEQLAAAAAVGVFPSGSGLAGKQVFEEGEEGEEEEDTPSARQRRQQRQITAAEDHSETSSTTSSHRSEHKSGDEKSEQQPDEISVDSGGAEEPFDSEDSDVEYGVDGEEEVIIRPIERRMSDLSSSLTYSNMMNQADVGLLSKSPTIFSILKQDVAPSGSVLGMLSSSASSTGSSHLTGTAARVGLPPLAGKKSVTSASSSSSTHGIQIASGGKKPKHPGAYMGSPTDDLQFSISLDPNEDSILDQELEEEESTTPAEPIRENEFMNY